jgi:hypothetical protein
MAQRNRTAAEAALACAIFALAKAVGLASSGYALDGMAAFSPMACYLQLDFSSPSSSNK